MRISDWSSDVCSSDLTLNRDILPTGSELPKLPIGSELPKPPTPGAARRGEEASRRHEIQPAARLSRRLPGALAGGDGIGRVDAVNAPAADLLGLARGDQPEEIGRASGRERGGRYGE